MKVPKAAAGLTSDLLGAQSREEHHQRVSAESFLPTCYDAPSGNVERGHLWFGLCVLAREGKARLFNPMGRGAHSPLPHGLGWCMVRAGTAAVHMHTRTHTMHTQIRRWADVPHFRAHCSQSTQRQAGGTQRPAAAPVCPGTRLDSSACTCGQQVRGAAERCILAHTTRTQMLWGAAASGNDRWNALGGHLGWKPGTRQKGRRTWGQVGEGRASDPRVEAGPPRKR